MNEDCIFCKIAADVAPSYKIWENDEFMAFLGIFPSTKGMSVVIPKKHYGSYVFEMDDVIYCGLLKAAKEVALLLDRKLGSMRTMLLAEGLEIDHAHVKLYPLYHGLPGTEIFHNGPRAKDEELEEIRKKIAKK